MTEFVFTPIESAPDRSGWEFRPLEADGKPAVQQSRPIPDSVPEQVAGRADLDRLGGLEAAANFGSQVVSLPVAGLAGLATAGARAIGMTDVRADDVVHSVGNALTYEPRSRLGKRAAAVVAWPFEKLAEAGEYAGDKTLESTGSPTAGAAVSSAIQLAPMFIDPLVKGARSAAKKISTRRANDVEDATANHAETSVTPGESPATPVTQGSRQSEVASRGQGGNQGDAPAGYRFIPLNEATHEAPTRTRTQRLEGDDKALHGTEHAGMEVVRSEGNQGLPGVAYEFRPLSDGHGTGADAVALARQAERDPGLLEEQLRLDNARGADESSSVLPEADAQGRANDSGAGGEATRTADTQLGTETAGVGLRSGEPGGEVVSPVDLANASRRDVATTGMGAEDRPAGAGRVVADQAWMDDRTGADAGQVPHQRTARYALIEATDLTASHDVNMQPVPANPFARQNATRHENEMATQGIVSDFEPNRLADALHDADGAPIVARDGVVEAGQRRAIAIKRVYQANGQKAENYRGYLRQNAPSFGLDPSSIDAMKKPVLVRVPDEPAPREVQNLGAGAQNSWAPGANYAPLIDDSHAPAVAPTTAPRAKPITREEILTPFMKALNVPIYEGRVTGKRLGYYMPKRETVRIKRKGDLEVAAHEIAHLIDDRVPEIRIAYKDHALANELKSVSYDRQSVKEGFAEFMRLYLTQPEMAAERAPRFSAWMDKFVERHEYGPAIKKASEDMTSWFGQEAIDRARSKIGYRQPINEALNGIWDRFRQATVDDLHGIYRMERDLKGNKIEPAGAYETARLARASHSITDGAIQYGHPVRKPDGSFTFAGKGLEEILKPVAQHLDDFLLYAVGRSSQELMGQKREHLFTPGEIRAMVALEKPEFRQAFNEYQKWNSGVLDFAESHGVVNPAARSMWQRQSYMPFHRVGQAGEWKGGKPGDWSGIKALTGGTDNLKSILGNMVQNAATLIDKSVKNEARLAVVKLAEKNRGGGRFLQEIPKEARPVKIAPEMVMDAILKALGVDQKGSVSPQMKKLIARLREQVGNAPEAFEFMLHDKAPAGGNVVAVLEGGKPRYFEVADPLLMRALSSIDRTNQHWLIKWLGYPKRIGQMAVTLTPDFMAANIARDTLMGSIMSHHGFRPVIDSLDGMRLRLMKDPIYKDFIANGGGLSSIYLDEQKFRAKLEKFYTRQGIDYRTVLDAPDKLLGFVETVADAFESSTRVGEYKRAVQAGESPRHAAYLGRDVSTDFAMRGDSQALGMMYDTVMFLKPAVLSFDRLARGLAHDPNRGAIATKAGLIALSSMALYMLNRNDPRYQDLPDWDRDTNWHFFIGDQHFRYPKLWEIGYFASAAERTLERTLQTDPKGLATDLVRILGQTFNVNLMPQLVAPLYEQATNRNSFTGAPIETPGMQDVQPFLRAKPGTSETMKAAGMATRDLPESIQVNPARAEALLRGYFNTWAMYGLQLTDQALFKDRLPEKRLDELPVVRRFYSQYPARTTKYESMFYDLLGEADRLRGTLKQLDKMGRSDLADEKEKSPLAGEAKPLERAAKNLSAINRDMESVRRNQLLTPTQKREQLDALTVERNALLKDAVVESKSTQLKGAGQ